MTTSSRSLALLFLGAALMGGCEAEQTTTPTSETTVLPTDDLRTVESRSTIDPFCKAATQENFVLSLLNQRRAAGANCGGVAKMPVPPLSVNARLTCTSTNHAQDMATNGYLGYISLNGWTPLRRVTNAGYTPLSYVEENVAAGYSTVEAVVDAWMANPRDCNNIMSPAHIHVGIGQSTVQGSTYSYWVLDFGRP
ncbi:MULTISPECIES: CAP domain-containing protein [unclassified Corallococcus]|uniref:CAP domain-containing protein n=1 Tax=unclassified Corallococcus TaxID=2685029 RepID=UPI001A8FCE2E|nr:MULTISPECIES: CAP domain-containing protein [unclassified Corallococcus]MBN9682603.1 CAP domain-containing protein [Corallococcus sp. NCSPR001]WAS85851.1 CAP domain-containing protein [Corallococcus sp. NCRR]